MDSKLHMVLTSVSEHSPNTVSPFMMSPPMTLRCHRAPLWQTWPQYGRPGSRCIFHLCDLFFCPHLLPWSAVTTLPHWEKQMTSRYLLRLHSVICGESFPESSPTWVLLFRGHLPSAFCNTYFSSYRVNICLSAYHLFIHQWIHDPESGPMVSGPGIDCFLVREMTACFPCSKLSLIWDDVMKARGYPLCIRVHTTGEESQKY